MNEEQKGRTGAIFFIIGSINFIQEGLFAIVWCIFFGIDFGAEFFLLTIYLLQLLVYPIVGAILLVVAVQILLNKSTIRGGLIVLITITGVSAGLFINIIWGIGYFFEPYMLICYTIIPLIFECGLPAVGAWLIYTSRTKNFIKT
ncbi:MAG TPA: hypothetical protein VMV49_10315 [Candidatus Deferrimicrobium sp.]|nr:hypothetical protein [Candidatus Deferrimicrobium sp.]